MAENESQDPGAAEGGAPEPEHPWQAALETYPERAPEEDPSWAVKIARGWLWTALGFTVFVITLIVLGVFYD